MALSPDTQVNTSARAIARTMRRSPDVKWDWQLTARDKMQEWINSSLIPELFPCYHFWLGGDLDLHLEFAWMGNIEWPRYEGGEFL